MVTLNHLARTVDGRALIVSLMVSDPDEVFPASAVATQGLAVVRGAFQLLEQA